MATTMAMAMAQKAVIKMQPFTFWFMHNNNNYGNNNNTSYSKSGKEDSADKAEQSREAVDTL